MGESQEGKDCRKRNYRKMNKVIASLILVLMTAPLGAQVPADVPKLVVGITIDQLRVRG